jgi:hypothetical protein
MGITIHYSGKAKSKRAVEKIMGIAMAMGAEHEWRCAQVEDPDGEILRPIFDPDGTAGNGSGIEEYHGPVSMLVASPGEGCESLRLMFGNDLRMDGFTKTQYGPIETHVRICEVLRAIEPHFETLHVIDEGGYWETGDLKELDERRQTLFDVVAELKVKLDAARAKKAAEDMYTLDGDDGDIED